MTLPMPLNMNPYPLSRSYRPGARGPSSGLSSGHGRLEARVQRRTPVGPGHPRNQAMRPKYAARRLLDPVRQVRGGPTGDVRGRAARVRASRVIVSAPMTTKRPSTRKTTPTGTPRPRASGARTRKAGTAAITAEAPAQREAGIPTDTAAGGGAATAADTLPSVALYADGACSGNPGPGGWGAILVSPLSGKRLEISGSDLDTTNNRMEMIGVIEGLRRLKTKSRVRVVTDSRYVVDGMKSWIYAWRRNGWMTSDKKPVKNKDLWEQLSDLSREHETAFEWVRGHKGHAENERCDELARTAIDTARKLAAGPGRSAAH